MSWWLFILCLLSMPLRASPIDVAKLDEKLPVSADFEVLEDSSSALRVEAVRESPSWKFLERGQRTFKFGITDRAYWVRATLTNSGLDAKSFYLVSEDPRTDFIDFYYFDEQSLLFQKHTGDYTPFSSRGFFYRGYAFLLTIEPGISRQVYMRFQSTAPVEIDLQVYSTGALERDATTAGQAGTLYFGGMASIVLFNFLLFVTSRQRIYLSYCMFQLATAGAIAISFGAAYGLLWPDSPRLNAMMSIFLPCLAPALALTFTASYLGLHENQRKLWWSLQGLAVILGSVGLLGAWHGFPFLMKTLYYLLIVAPILVLSILIGKSLQRNRPASLFLIAWIPLLLAALIYSLGRLGYSIIPLPQGLELAFGSIWEAVFLSLCLGDKFNQIKKQEMLYLRRIQEEELTAREARLIAELRRRENLISEREATANRNLIRVICHDLANPLNIILNYSAMFEKKDLVWSDVQPYLKKVHKAAVHQQEIIEHIREFEALNSGKHQIKLQAVSLWETLKQVQDLIRQKLDEKKIQLLIQGLESDVLVMAEQRSLTYNVLTNLLSNALKFSPDGSTVEIDVVVSQEQVDLVIIDHGIGMDRELVENIFDMASPTTRPGLKGEKGTGFGLPIVKSYVEKYGGSVSVESSPIEEDPEHHGTRFCLRFKRGYSLGAAAS